MVQYGRRSRSSWAKSVRSPSGRTVMGKVFRESSFWTLLGKVSNCECLFVNREKGLFLSVNVDDVKLAGKKENIDPMCKVPMKEGDLGEPTSFLDHGYLGCTQRECETSKGMVDNVRNMFESLQEQKKSCLILRNLVHTFPHGPVIWKVMQRNVWNDVATWRTKPPSNCTKLQLHAVMTIK